MSVGTLYQIADVVEAVDRAIAEAEGELTPQLEAALDQITLDFSEKVEKIALYIKDLSGDAAKIKAEEERLAARRKSLESRVVWLKDYLFRNLERVGRDKVNGLLASVAIRWNPPSIQEVVPTSPEDLIAIAAECPGTVTIVPSFYQWDKKALLAAAKLGALPEQVAKRVQVVRTQRLEVK